MEHSDHTFVACVRCLTPERDPFGCFSVSLFLPLSFRVTRVNGLLRMWFDMLVEPPKIISFGEGSLRT